VAAFSALRRLVSVLGPVGTVGLVCRKLAKRQRYERLLKTRPEGLATLKAHPPIVPTHGDAVVDLARSLLNGHDTIFAWPVDLNRERAWEYDPIEQKYWPRRHYTETHLHAADTPRDAKIVWEINRFAHLPAFGQAALLTADSAFEREAEARMLSWIEGNPFAETVNWASALEISIRLLSWTTTMLLLREASFEIHKNEKIRRSIHEQACYLAADLSTDKVIPSNHLIGEAAGLFIVASLWEHPEAKAHAARARKILEAEIIRQTFSDGVSREASGWYHQFVTHFFDLADRVATRSTAPFSQSFRERLSKMKSYLSAITTPDGVARYGDADDGYALWLAGDMDAWKDALFGQSTLPVKSEQGVFPDSKYAAFHIGNSFLFVRAGEFGMGGDGSSSHAHDDFLSPMAWLAGLPVIVDPGTFVYNGNPDERSKYRGWQAHNAFAIDSKTGAEQKLNFGWSRVRPPATVVSETSSDQGVGLAATFGEWPNVTRGLLLSEPATAAVASLDIIDVFEYKNEAPYKGAEWRLHLDPRWKQKVLPPQIEAAMFEDANGNLLAINHGDSFDAATVETYDYSPLYGVAERALMFRAYRAEPIDTIRIRIALFTPDFDTEAALNEAL
jgi:hypothetical protein